MFYSHFILRRYNFNRFFKKNDDSQNRTRSENDTMLKFSAILRRSIKFANQNFENSEHIFNSIDELTKKQNDNQQLNLNE